MIVSYNWLKELINLNVTPEKLVEEMSLYSVEVETWKKMVSANNLVVGYVKECVPHENSDHLHVCQIDLGDHVDQIVCGAPNMEQGKKVIVALPGCVLPGGTISKSKVRGVESNGMCCSLQELGIENKYVPERFQNGIYLFNDDAKVGSNALEALMLDDYVIELALTPNRMDLMSMLGVAHDMKAMYNLPINYPTADFTETNVNTKDEVSVEIKTDKCKSYYARVVNDVEIKESPLFIKQRLIASGIRPINNVVDITNYVLVLFGQPLHSFDKDLLGKNIIVRNALKDEKLVTLDDQERTLDVNDIVISDEKDNNRAVCLAGVMGGKSTEVTPNTKNIVLESAVFDGLTVRRTSARVQLRSESSVRYERGVDLNNSLNAVNYACYLLEKYASGKVAKGYVHAGIEFVEDKVIEVSTDYVKNYLGITISQDKIVSILESLDFKVEVNGNNIKAYVPNRRLDVNIKQDLVEEIARIYGYDKLNESLPLMICEGEFTHPQLIRKTINKTLIGLGLNETVTYSLVSEKLSNQYNYLTKDTTPIKLQHPMTDEHSILRRTLVPSLLNVVAYNNARKNYDLGIYEIGMRYYMKDDAPVEEYLLAGAIQGKRASKMWNGEVENVDFFYAKGILENLFDKLQVKVTYKKMEDAGTDLHPGRSAQIMLNNKVIGYVGEVHPTLVKDLEIETTYVFEVELNAIYAVNNGIINFKQISKVPSVERDLALVMDINTPVGDVVNTIYSSDKEMIKAVEVFDVYQGEHMEEGKKSVAVRITLSSMDTLTDEVVNQKIKRILGTLAYMYHIELRK